MEKWLKTLADILDITWGTYGSFKNCRKWPGHGMIQEIHIAERLSMDWSSHEPCNGPRQEILIAETDVAGHGRVSLPEDLCHGLELRAHLDEAIQLDTRLSAPHTEALHQCLWKLGTQVVAHLSEGWGQEMDRAKMSVKSIFWDFSVRMNPPVIQGISHIHTKAYLAVAPCHWCSLSGLCHIAERALSTAA